MKIAYEETDDYRVTAWTGTSPRFRIEWWGGKDAVYIHPHQAGDLVDYLNHWLRQINPDKEEP